MNHKACTCMFLKILDFIASWANTVMSPFVFHIIISLRRTNAYCSDEYILLRITPFDLKRKMNVCLVILVPRLQTEYYSPMTYQNPSFSPSFKWQVPPCLHGLLMHAWIGTSQSCPWRRNGQVKSSVNKVDLSM